MSCYKILQRQCYSLLSSRCGLALFTCTIILLLISIIQFGEVLLEWSIEQYEVQFSLYRDNIVGRSFEKQFTPELPIDVVYTWVNGSDPILLKQLEELKKEEKPLNNSTSHDAISFNCPFINCFSCDAVIMDGNGHDNLTLHDIKSHSPLIAGAHVIKAINSSNDGLVYYIKLSNEEQVNQLLNSTNNSLFRRAFLTMDESLYGLYRLPDVAMVINHSNSTSTLAGVNKLVYKSVGVALAYYNPGVLDHVINQSSMAWKLPHNVTVHPVYLLWQPFRVPLVANSNQSVTADNASRDDISVNRFYDNEELRYSLRSVEKYAPWIRNIYIVTNGQIPSWLKVDHPRLTIVSHEAIFTDSSHLPTFSSPAIETHVHRIPGLSNHFIYLNDDVMFGDHVWPEDFVTDSRGYKVYMAWSVPYCAEGCPPNWINDRYCDRACNNSMCDYDGEDCKNRTSYGSYSQWHSSQHSLRSLGSTQCSTGCIPSWLGDRYCDHVCRVPECGYDTGDCGTDDYTRLYGVMLSHDQHYIIPSGVKAMYFNLSGIFSNNTVTSAEMNSNSIITAAVVSQKFKVLTVVFTDKVNRTTVAMTVTGITSTSNKTQVFFNVTVDTSVNLMVNGSRPPFSYPQYNTTDQHFLEMVSMTIQNSDQSINFWVSERATTLPLSAVKLSTPIITNITANYTGLPANVSEALQQLQREYDSGDLTEQGLVKQQNLIISSYLNVSHDERGRVLQRKLLSLDETELADWIMNSKMKQISLANDIDRAIQQWEWQHGPWHSDYISQQYKGKFPWENDIAKDVPKNDYMLPRRQRRHLLDTFADSLRYVNKLYNKVYGYVSRKVPAHMPHMINKEIMQRLQDTYPEEYEQTSAHKLRTTFDMQFSFSYFYFVISETCDVSIDQVFQELDLDQSGILSIRELRTLITKLYELPIYLEVITSCRCI